MRKTRRFPGWRLLSVVVVAACSDIEGPTEPATELANGLRREGRFYIFPKPALFVDSATFIQPGVRGMRGGNCQWVVQNQRLGKGQRVIERLAGYDPDSCDLIIARGTNMRAPVMTERHGSQSVAFLPTGNPNGSPPAGSVTAAYCVPDDGGTLLNCAGIPERCRPPSVDIGRARQSLWFEDPAFINVTEDRMYIQWNYNNECVSNASGVHDMVWLWLSGWRLTHHDQGLYYDWDLLWVLGYGKSYYMNSSFPLCIEHWPLNLRIGTVYSNIRQNDIYGINDGYAGFNWKLDITGTPACTALLTPQRLAENF